MTEGKGCRVLLLTGYALLAFLFATWSDAMDSRYAPDRHDFPRTVMLGALWPLSTPIALLSLTMDGSRWTKGMTHHD